MIVLLPLLFALIGLLLYAFASNGKLIEIGRLTFAAGMLAFLLNAHQIVSLLPR